MAVINAGSRMCDGTTQRVLNPCSTCNPLEKRNHRGAMWLLFVGGAIRWMISVAW